MDLIKAIIFDCDGTLVDSEAAHYDGWHQALQNHDYHLSLEEYCPYVGNSGQTNARLFAEKAFNASAAELLIAKRKHYDQFLDTGHAEIKSTVDFLRHLARNKESHSIKLGLASAARKEEIFGHLNHLKITHFFDAVLSGQSDLTDYHDPEGTNKPKPYIYLQTAKTLGIDPSECVVIEDSHTGVKAGIAAGCITIAVPNSFTKEQDFSMADLILESFEGVSLTGFLALLTKAVERKTNF